MKSSKQQVFAELMADRANRLCVDCSTPNPQWASVSHGSFLCIKCAGVHRSLGVHISFVRSITMDSWSPLQLEKMKAGGNARFLAYLQKQKFPKKLPHEQKYDSKACENYREHISAVSRGESAKDLPFVGYKKKTDTNLGDFQVNGSGRNQRPVARTRSPARPSGNGFNHSRSGGPAMIGFGSDGAASSQSQDSTWSWDNISSALKSAATTVADTSKVAANIVAEKSRTAAKSAQSLTSESDMASTLGQQANAGWGAMRSAMSGVAASARSMISEEDPVQFYRREDCATAASSNHASSSTAGFAPKSLSSDTYFNATNQPSSSIADNSKSRSSAEASLDAFFSDAPRAGNIDLVDNENAEGDDDDGFSWGFKDSSAVEGGVHISKKEPKPHSSARASAETRNEVRALKSDAVKREKSGDGWGFGDDDSDDQTTTSSGRVPRPSHKKVENDACNADDSWDWD